MDRNRIILEVPNGGFGWIIVCGAFVINVFNQAFLSVFGLIFGPFFNLINESKSHLALVVNLSCLFLNLSGLITGALLKKFSTRKLCVAACLMTCIGLSLTSMSTSLYQIIITFSFLTGAGLGLLNNSILVAVTSYFTTKKQMAVSLTMAGTGIGQVLLPQIVRFSITHFGYRGAILIMSGLMLNGVAAALFFQPVEWHMKAKNHDDESQPLLVAERRIESEDQQQTFWQRVAHSMDLSLLKDSHFVILSFGLAVGYAVSVDFSLILPIFLQETVKLNKDQTAMCLSTLATFDLISRLTFHFFTSKMNFSSQKIYVIGLIFLGIIRSILAELTTYSTILIACATFGYFRALVVVNQVLIVSDHCSKNYPEKFGGALGLNMVLRGISIMTFGQLLGFTRDHLNSYIFGLHSENLVLIFILIIWTIDYLYRFR